MEPKFFIGQRVIFQNQISVILSQKENSDGINKYYCQIGESGLTMWVLENNLEDGNPTGPPLTHFNRRTPHLIIVDSFYKNPDEIRSFAMEQEFEADNRFYKGKRTKERFLWPFLKEEFERIIGRPIIDWLNQPANGCFQITGYNDTLVYHSDAQSYAAAIYLTPFSPPSAGTSFWRDKKHHSRRPTNHPLEFDRFQTDDQRRAADEEIYNDYNILHPDNWELVDKVGAIYNRLAIWDAKMIHSASTYEGLQSDVVDKARMVQLFFFTVR
jgi:hypothetical protein